MHRGLLVVSTLCLGTLASGCGGECGVGTLRYGDQCVAVDPFDTTPPEVLISPDLYTREVGTVRLSVNEPATIYYTIDGTQPTLESPNEPDFVLIPNVPDNAQLRYFAVDLAGNRSPDGLRLWIIDRDGPSAPQDFGLTFNNPSRTVTWSPPPDPRPGGLLVARVEGTLDASPVPGTAYAVGDQIGPGITVVRADGPEVSGIQTFSESMPAGPGLVRYVAWGFDNLYNYGPPAGDYALVPTPPQTTTINVDAGTLAVTVPVQPSYMNITGSATLNAGTLTVELTLRNDTTRVVFAPKLVVTSTITGVTWSNSDGMLGGTLPYRAFGPGIRPGATRTTTLTFTGATAQTTLSLQAEIRDNPILFATTWDDSSAGQLVDAETGRLLLDLPPGAMGQGGDGMTQRGGITPDGRMLVGARTIGAVSTFDLSRGNRQLTVELRPQKSHVFQVILDRGGSTAYALVAEGHPQNINSNGTGGSKSELVRLDAGTLAITGRLEIGNSRNRNVDLSPDGKTLLIATGITSQGALVIDLPTFTIKHRLLTGFRPQVALFVPSVEGSTIAVIGEQVKLFAADGTPSATFTTPGTNGKVLRAALGTGSTLWIGRRSELASLDLSTGTSQLYPELNGYMLERYGDKLFAMNTQPNLFGIIRLDLTGTRDLLLTGFTNYEGHWIGRSPF